MDSIKQFKGFNSFETTMFGLEYRLCNMAGESNPNNQDYPIPVADGGSGAATATEGFDNLAPTTTQGDLITRGASDNERLAVGSNGEVLKVVAGVPAWAADTAGYTFTQDTTTSISMAIDTVYTSDNAATVTATLPATAVVGSLITITRIGAGGLVIDYTTDQVIHFGKNSSTVTSGSFTSTNQYDSMTLRCVVADDEWVVEKAIGRWTKA